MKKLWISMIGVLLLMNSCFLGRQKYGCPSDGRNVGAEKILAGEKVKKAKWRGDK